MGVCCCCSNVTVEFSDVSNLETLINDSKQWKTGDILMEHYVGASASMVEIGTGSHFNHVGLIYVDKAEGNKRKYIEMTAKGFLSYDIDEHAEYFLNKDDGHFVGYRALNNGLTEEQLVKFEEGMQALKEKKYDFGLSQVGAAVDCNCCLSFCNDKDNEEKRLERLFCSELSAELLQRCGIMKTNIESDEYVPGDFDEGREEKWIVSPFEYGKVKLYSKQGTV